MKKCSYCGAEYSDDLEACPVDNNPLVDSALSESLVNKRRLPLSLIIVSCLFLYPAINGFISFATGMNLVMPKIHAMDGNQLIVCIGYLLWILSWPLLCFGVVVGLWKRSRFCYVIALLGYCYAYAVGVSENVRRLMDHFSPREPYYWCAVTGVALGAAIFLWPLYVLLRRDVRRIFWNAKTDV